MENNDRKIDLAYMVTKHFFTFSLVTEAVGPPGL